MQKKYFSRYKKSLTTLPNLVESQLKSFNWVIENGLGELFKEFSPIKDYSGMEIDENKVKKSAKAVPIGPTIMLDSERCILCSRCVRFSDEITKIKRFVVVERIFCSMMPVTFFRFMISAAVMK